MVVNDALEFLRARGQPTDHLTDYEIQDAFAAAFKNHQHDLVEQAFFIGLPWVANPGDWRKYCNDLHGAVEGTNSSNIAEHLLSVFMHEQLPVAN